MAINVWTLCFRQFLHLFIIKIKVFEDYKNQCLKVIILKMDKKERLKIIEKASKQVGPGVFYSTIVVITSFLPVFLLTGIEGKLFHPLAWTKTFILIIDAFLAITLAPVLISFFLKGNLKPESANPVTL